MNGKEEETAKMEEQRYRLRVFLEIITEADMLLLKKLVKKRKALNNKKPVK